MKKNISILVSVVLFVAVFFPMTIYAKTYTMSDTDMKISVDDSVWYVFTRDNIKNNSELVELGVSYDEMYNILYRNEAYMDAILYYLDGEYIELFVRKRTMDSGIVNLSNYKSGEVLELAQELAKEQGADNYSVYENGYKFARLEYIDYNYGYYICEFVTCVNKDNYTITFQSTSKFTEEEYVEIEKIVDSIRFDVDETIREKKSASISESIIEKAVGGAVIGGIAGAIAAISNKKKKRNDREEASAVDITKTD